MFRRSWIGVIVAVFTTLIVTAGWAQGQQQQQRPARPTRSGDPRRAKVYPKVGDVVKDFLLKDVKGKDVKLSDFTKKKQIFVLELGACT